MKKRNFWLGFGVLLIIVGSVYIRYQTQTIYGGDAGDIASAIVTTGIPHPPGYPLYTALGVFFDKLILFGTHSYRIAFVSTLPSLLSFILLYDLLFIISGQVFLPLVSILTVVFTYPIWLYSEVVEVFALHNLFMVVLLWTSVRFNQSRQHKFLLLFFYILGLSFTHHQIIILILPSIFYLLYKSKSIKGNKYNLKYLFVFLLGLAPLLYLVVSPISNPPLNWLGQPTPSNIFRLVTRAQYGTFVPGEFVAHNPLLRLFSLWALVDFILKDFRIFGFILISSGYVYLFIRKRMYFNIYFIAFLSYSFFYFYASYPLLENFTVGTFERFLQPLYIILTVPLLFGLISLRNIFLYILSRRIADKKINIVMYLFFLITLSYPLTIWAINFRKISILKADITAENLARDILNTVEDNAIVMLINDTSLFNTQYVYYTEKKWPNVKLIHPQKLAFEYYPGQLAKYYPELKIDNNAPDIFSKIINANYDRFPIYSSLSVSVSDGIWIPWGLLYRFYKKSDTPTPQSIVNKNKEIWSKYHDPLNGSLGKYTNLIQWEILRHYGYMNQEIGFWSAKNKYSQEAKEYIMRSTKYIPEDRDNYIILAQIYIQENECAEAKDQIDYLFSKDKEVPNYYLLASLNYKLCFKDDITASSYQRQYEEKSKGQETPLKKL